MSKNNDCEPDQDIDDDFDDRDVVATPEAAQIASFGDVNISDARARNLAHELDVPRVGNALAWGRRHVQALRDLVLEEEEDLDEEDDEESEDDGDLEADDDFDEDE